MSESKESRETTLQRHRFNFFPCYRANGAKVLFIASDWRQAKIELTFNWLTRNYVGTIFGGSMFAATDPIYMIMLIKLLGADFLVVDKAAWIKFIKPGTGKLYATFTVTEQDLDEIRDSLSKSKKMEKTFTVTLVDKDNNPHATVERVIYIRRKPKERAKASLW
jgi:acyl-coenzyme A thioesterase PaaI-like protein